MKCFLLLAALAFPAMLDAQQPVAANDSAYGALRLVGKTLGRDALDRVVEVAGREGSPQPFLWKITLAEPAGGTREVDVSEGKIAAQRTDAQSSAPKATVHLSDLNLDSSGAFDAADAQARKVHLRFDSVNYVLRYNDATGKPHWTLTLFNKEGSEVGAMRFGANDGNILSIDGRLASAPAPISTATPRPPTAVVTATIRPRETATPAPHVVESRTTTITTTVVTPPPPPPPAVTTETVVVDTTAPDTEGGLFTRTGRTLDKTSRNVGDTLDKTGHNVGETLRRTGARVQRFFTGGRGDSEQPVSTATPDPNFRGD